MEDDNHRLEEERAVITAHRFLFLYIQRHLRQAITNLLAFKPNTINNSNNVNDYDGILDEGEATDLQDALGDKNTTNFHIDDYELRVSKCVEPIVMLDQRLATAVSKSTTALLIVNFTLSFFNVLNA